MERCFLTPVLSATEVDRIELYLSAGENRDLVFAANDPALTISAQDVNQDGIPDLIVEQAFTHKRIQVWLNDGHGKFRRVRVEISWQRRMHRAGGVCRSRYKPA